MNQRPHPYQVSRAQRCAQGRFPRSPAGVRGEGCVLSDLVPSGAGQARLRWPLVRESTIPIRRRLRVTLTVLRPDPIADPLLGPDRNQSRSGRPDCRNRSRLSLLEPVGEGGVAVAGALAGARGALQAEWPVVALEATRTWPRDSWHLVVSATQATRATPHATGEDPQPAVDRRH